MNCAISLMRGQSGWNSSPAPTCSSDDPRRQELRGETGDERELKAATGNRHRASRLCGAFECVGVSFEFAVLSLGVFLSPTLSSAGVPPLTPRSVHSRLVRRGVHTALACHGRQRWPMRSLRYSTPRRPSRTKTSSSAPRRGRSPPGPRRYKALRSASEV